MTEYLTLTEFVPGTKAKAEDVNANFAAVKNAITDDIMTKQGNTFNGNSELVQLTINGKLPAIDGSNLKNISQNALEQNLTDCILESPNGIASSSNSTLVIKEGLKILIPNGRNTDGTLKNLEYTLPSDVSFTYTISTEILKDNIFLNSSGEIVRLQYENCYLLKHYSELTSYTGTNQNRIAFVSEDNKYYQTTDTGVTWVEKQFTKICITSVSSTNVITSLFVNPVMELVKKSDYSPCITAATTISSATNSCPAVVIENFVNGISWWRKYSDGWIEQGSIGTNARVIPLLKVMSNTNYSVIFIPSSGNVKNGYCADESYIYNKTISSFSLGGSNCWGYWVVRGY